MMAAGLVIEFSIDLCIPKGIPDVNHLLALTLTAAIAIAATTQPYRPSLLMNP